MASITRAQQDALRRVEESLTYGIAYVNINWHKGDDEYAMLPFWLWLAPLLPDILKARPEGELSYEWHPRQLGGHGSEETRHYASGNWYLRLTVVSKLQACTPNSTDRMYSYYLERYEATIPRLDGRRVDGGYEVSLSASYQRIRATFWDMPYELVYLDELPQEPKLPANWERWVPIRNYPAKTSVPASRRRIAHAMRVGEIVIAPDTIVALSVYTLQPPPHLPRDAWSWAWVKMQSWPLPPGADADPHRGPTSPSFDHYRGPNELRSHSLGEGTVLTPAEYSMPPRWTIVTLLTGERNQEQWRKLIEETPQYAFLLGSSVLASIAGYESPLASDMYDVRGLVLSDWSQVSTQRRYASVNGLSNPFFKRWHSWTNILGNMVRNPGALDVDPVVAEVIEEISLKELDTIPEANDILRMRPTELDSRPPKRGTYTAVSVANAIRTSGGIRIQGHYPTMTELRSYMRRLGPVVLDRLLSSLMTAGEGEIQGGNERYLPALANLNTHSDVVARLSHADALEELNAMFPDG